MPTFDPTDLIGRPFLLPPEENGERHRAKVTRKVVGIIDQENGHRVENINFILDITIKLYIVAGPEFQELEGYILIFLKALYGLKSSGKRWAGVIHGILRDMKLLPSRADPCIWLRKAPNLRCYEYIAVYVDDLCIAGANELQHKVVLASS